jgi:hypothetical protein
VVRDRTAAARLSAEQLSEVPKPLSTSKYLSDHALLL